MPIEIHKSVEPIIEAQDVDALLFENGSPTLAGQVLTDFLESVEFDALLDDKDLAELIEVSEAYVTGGDAAELTLVDEGTEGAELVLLQTMDGELVAEATDLDDMYGMFEHFVSQLAESTLEEKILKATGLGLLGENYDLTNLSEASVFKKGDFRKIHAGTNKTTSGKTGPALVNRMLGAMLKKEAIKRAKAPGAGYKKGDYEKEPAGYGGGTAKGRKAVMMFKSKNKAKLAVKAKRVKGASGSDAKLKAVAVAAAAKAKAKANGLLKKKSTLNKMSSKKSIVASDSSAVHSLHEGFDPMSAAVATQRAGIMAKSLTRTK